MLNFGKSRHFLHEHIPVSVTNQFKKCQTTVAFKNKPEYTILSHCFYDFLNCVSSNFLFFCVTPELFFFGKSAFTWLVCGDWHERKFSFISNMIFLQIHDHAVITLVWVKN